jgi:hypothetical protein
MPQHHRPEDAGSEDPAYTNCASEDPACTNCASEDTPYN